MDGVPTALNSTSSEATRTALTTSASGARQDSGGVFWPAVLLPDVVPNTKIHTWGYDADIDGFWSSSSQNTVAQHAANLLSDVADLLETNGGNLPVVFVVHSLGGIVVKAVVLKFHSRISSC